MVHSQKIKLGFEGGLAKDQKTFDLYYHKQTIFSPTHKQEISWQCLSRVHGCHWLGPWLSHGCHFGWVKKLKSEKSNPGMLQQRRQLTSAILWKILQQSWCYNCWLPFTMFVQSPNTNTSNVMVDLNASLLLKNFKTLFISKRWFILKALHAHIRQNLLLRLNLFSISIHALNCIPVNINISI